MFLHLWKRHEGHCNQVFSRVLKEHQANAEVGIKDKVNPGPRIGNGEIMSPEGHSYTMPSSD